MSDNDSNSLIQGWLIKDNFAFCEHEFIIYSSRFDTYVALRGWLTENSRRSFRGDVRIHGGGGLLGDAFAIMHTLVNYDCSVTMEFGQSCGVYYALLSKCVFTEYSVLTSHGFTYGDEADKNQFGCIKDVEAYIAYVSHSRPDCIRSDRAISLISLVKERHEMGCLDPDFWFIVKLPV